MAQEFVDVETAKQAGRTAFGQMVDYLSRHRKTCRSVLVEKTDRLYRNLRDYVTLDELNLEVHFVKENFVLSDGSRSAEKFMHGIKVLMAKNYVDNLSEEASKGMTEKAAQGIWPSAAPAGYMNVQEGDKRVIIPDPETAPLVRRIFETYATGQSSFRELADWAAAQGFRTRFAKRPGKTTIERILKNPIYIGTFEWNRRTHQGTHEPLVSVDLFHRAQQALRSTLHPVREDKRTFAYVGLMTCSHCGCSVTADIQKGKYIYYHCTGSQGECKKPAIREDRLEKLLGEIVAAIRIDDGLIEWIIGTLKASHRDEQVFHDEQISKLRAEVDGLQDRLDAAYEDKLDGLIGDETWRKKSREWRNRQMELQASLEQHQEASLCYFDAGVKLLELARDAADLWTNQSQIERRKLLNLVGSNFSWDGLSLTAIYRKPFCCAITVIAWQKGLTVLCGGADGARTRDFHLDRVAL